MIGYMLEVMEPQRSERRRLHGTQALARAGAQERFQNLLELQLAEIWRDCLGLSSIGRRENWVALVPTPQALSRLFRRIDRTFGVDFSEPLHEHFTTIASQATHIHELARDRAASETIVSLREGRQAPVFFVHGGGGTLETLSALAQRISPGVAVYGIQSQALRRGESALLYIEDAAARYVTEMRRVCPRGPYRLIGYSFGGAIVAEMAHQLRASGDSISLLGMLDSRSSNFEAERLGVVHRQGKLQRRWQRLHAGLLHRSLAAQVAFVVRKLKTRMVRYAASLTLALRFRRLPSIRDCVYDLHYISFHHYRPRHFDGEMVLFRAGTQEFSGGDHDLGWGPAFRSVTVRQIDGNHDSILFPSRVGALARRINEALRAA